MFDLSMTLKIHIKGKVLLGYKLPYRRILFCKIYFIFHILSYLLIIEQQEYIRRTSISSTPGYPTKSHQGFLDMSVMVLVGICDWQISIIIDIGCSSMILSAWLPDSLDQVQNVPKYAHLKDMFHSIFFFKTDQIWIGNNHYPKDSRSTDIPLSFVHLL